MDMDNDKRHAERVRLRNSPTAIDIVCKGSDDLLGLVEVEYRGRSVRLGEWFDRPDGFATLRFDLMSLLDVVHERLMDGHEPMRDRQQERVAETVEALATAVAHAREKHGRAYVRGLPFGELLDDLDARTGGR